MDDDDESDNNLEDSSSSDVDMDNGLETILLESPVSQHQDDMYVCVCMCVCVCVSVHALTCVFACESKTAIIHIKSNRMDTGNVSDSSASSSSGSSDELGKDLCHVQ